MEIMNFFFCVRVTFFLIYILFTPTSSCYYFLKKWNLSTVHLGVLLCLRGPCRPDVPGQPAGKGWRCTKQLPLRNRWQGETVRLVESGEKPAPAATLQTHPMTALSGTFGLSHSAVCLISPFLIIWVLSRWNSFTYNKTSLPMELP